MNEFYLNTHQSPHLDIINKLTITLNKTQNSEKKIKVTIKCHNSFPEDQQKNTVHIAFLIDKNRRSFAGKRQSDNLR